MSSALENNLCRLHQRRYGVSVASGTIGLALGLTLLGLSQKRVAVPSGVCLNVPLAVDIADAVPVYCDIDPGTLGLSAKTLQAVASPIHGVIAVHAYGMPCAINEIDSYCRSQGVPLIEDVAVAQGAVAGNRPAGSFGVLSVLSFGRGKIIDVG